MGKQQGKPGDLTDDYLHIHIPERKFQDWQPCAIVVILHGIKNLRVYYASPIPPEVVVSTLRSSRGKHTSLRIFNLDLVNHDPSVDAMQR